MRTKFFLPLLLLFVFACSNDETLDDTVPSVESTTIDLCSQSCSIQRQSCIDWAAENRTYRLNDCENIGTVRYEDVYCTRTVITGYYNVPIFSPEGEFVRYERRPIYGQEQYVCDQRRIVTRTAAQRQQYNACVQAAQEEYVNAIDECDDKYRDCIKKNKCDKGGGITL